MSNDTPQPNPNDSAEDVARKLLDLNKMRKDWEDRQKQIEEDAKNGKYT